MNAPEPESSGAAAISVFHQFVGGKSGHGPGRLVSRRAANDDAARTLGLWGLRSSARETGAPAPGVQEDRERSGHAAPNPSRSCPGKRHRFGWARIMGASPLSRHLSEGPEKIRRGDGCPSLERAGSRSAAANRLRYEHLASHRNHPVGSDAAAARAPALARRRTCRRESCAILPALPHAGFLAPPGTPGRKCLMSEGLTGSCGKGLLARASAAALAIILGSAGLALGATTFQASYLYTTAGPASGGTVVPIVGNKFQNGATVTVGGSDVTVTFHNSTRIGATMPALTAGTLYDVVVTNPGGGGSSTIPFGWFADFNDVPGSNPFHASVERILRDGITNGMPKRRLLRRSGQSRAPRWRSSCCAPSTAAPTFRPRRPARSSGTSAQTRFRGGLDRAALRRGHHRRLRRARPQPRQPAALLPGRIREPRPDGSLPPQGVRGRRPRARARHRGSSSTCRPRILWLPGSRRSRVFRSRSAAGTATTASTTPNTRGQMAVFMTKTFHRPDAIRFLKQASLGSKRRRHRHGPERWLPAVDGRSVLVVQLGLCADAVSGRTSAPSSPVDCTTGICHRDNYTRIRSDAVLPERDVQPGPASAARRPSRCTSSSSRRRSNRRGRARWSRTSTCSTTMPSATIATSSTT